MSVRYVQSLDTLILEHEHLVNLLYDSTTMYIYYHHGICIILEEAPLDHLSDSLAS